MRCHVCRASDTTDYACPACVTDTRRRLRELELYAAWLVLPTMLEPTRGSTGRRSPGYGSRPPLRDEVLVMLDKRSTTEQLGPDDEDGPLWPLLGTLHGLGLYVRDQLDDPHPRTVTMSGEIGYLFAHLDRAAACPWVVDVIADLRQLHAQARALSNDGPPRALGTCRMTNCGGDVYPAGSRGARCKRCGHTYTGLDLVKLQAAQQARHGNGAS